MGFDIKCWKVVYVSETPLRWYPTATVAAHSILLINPKYTNTYGKSFTPQSNKKKLIAN